nr:unnamed protein product [Digitaria exilis]
MASASCAPPRQTALDGPAPVAGAPGLGVRDVGLDVGPPGGDGGGRVERPGSGAGGDGEEGPVEEAEGEGSDGEEERALEDGHRS